MRKILIVDDDSGGSIINNIQMNYDNKKFIFIVATSLRLGWRAYQDNKDVDLIIMDACVDSEYNPDSMSLIVRIIDDGFKNDIIAASSLDEYNKMLMSAGATKAIKKNDFYSKLLW
jgi:hypothetical protein